MQNNTIIYSVIFLAIGIFGGWLIWGNCKPKDVQIAMSNTHQMPDGSMMSNGGNDTSMAGMMANMTASLQGKTGDEFDKEFLSEMIVHHEGAVEMAKLVLTNSKRPELIKLANDIISAQTGEIQMMQGWQKVWFK